MRILIYPHTLEIGGSQLNAVEVAGRLRERGHDVMVFGPAGALVPKIIGAGLAFLESPRPGLRPSSVVVRALRSVIRTWRPDVIHAFEWPPALEAYLATRRGAAVPVGTVMSMAVASFLPTDLTLTVGTEQMVAYERPRRGNRIRLLEPSVDLETNTQAAVLAQTRQLGLDHGIEDGELVIVSVCRLAHELKLEGLLSAIQVVGALSGSYRLRLLIVGDGPARAQVEQAASRANALAGRPIVQLSGEMADPRPAYGLADVCLGMGGSVLRAMSFGKPVIVQGERGFWQTLSPDSLSTFLWQGWYGVGGSVDDGEELLRTSLEPLLIDIELRRGLGDFARQIAAKRFGLDAAADTHLAVYEGALRMRPASWALAPSILAGSRYAGYFLREQVRSRLQIAQRDDFNASPIAARTGAPKPRADAVGR